MKRLFIIFFLFSITNFASNIEVEEPESSLSKNSPDMPMAELSKPEVSLEVEEACRSFYGDRWKEFFNLCCAHQTAGAYFEACRKKQVTPKEDRDLKTLSDFFTGQR